MDKREEYQLFLEYTVKMIERRETITTTYLSVNAAIVGIIALMSKDIHLELWGQQLAVLALLLAGIVSCSLWRKLIIQYSTLLGWWYEKLRDFEKDIPNSSKLLTREYHDLHQASPKKKPIGLTGYETGLSWLFTILYGLFSAVLVILFIHNWL